MHTCLKISMGSWPALCTQIHAVIFSFSYTLFWQTKQTLLSILLANHVLIEIYFQDEDFQMDTQSKLKNPW